MAHVKALRCRECSREYPIQPLNVCDFCFGPLEVVYDYDAIARRVNRESIEAGPLTSGLSVDVVDLDDTAGPHHRHPLGEICLIMPQDAATRFDGHGAGWCIYEPGSAHTPAVTEGRALVLYMLPEGRIEFTE